jgi:Domain of unknown function (DUF4189)
MRKTGMLMTAMTIALLAGAAPAFAGFGAIAYDQATGRYGFSWNEATQDRANQLARKDCGSDKCQLIPVPPAKCGALATTDNPKESTAWGASVRDDKAAAELGAVQGCQKRTAGQCKIRGSECNR